VEVGHGLLPVPSQLLRLGSGERDHAAVAAEDVHLLPGRLGEPEVAQRP
jgi:hypothetical protein